MSQHQPQRIKCATKNGGLVYLIKCLQRQFANDFAIGKHFQRAHLTILGDGCDQWISPLHDRFEIGGRSAWQADIDVAIESQSYLISRSLPYDRRQHGLIFLVDFEGLKIHETPIQQLLTFLRAHIVGFCTQHDGD